MHRRTAAAAILAGLTGTLLLTAAGIASAVAGQPLARYYGGSGYTHWTTTDTSTMPNYYDPAPEHTFGYTVPAGVPGTVPLLSCTYQTDGEPEQYLSVDSGGCPEGGKIAANEEQFHPGVAPPTITTLDNEGSLYVTPPADGTAVAPVYRCISPLGPVLITSLPPVDGLCGEESVDLDFDQLLGYAALNPVAPPSDLPEVPTAVLLPLAALGVLTAGTALTRRQARRQS